MHNIVSNKITERSREWRFLVKGQSRDGGQKDSRREDKVR